MAAELEREHEASRPSGPIRDPQSLVAGLALAVLALVALWGLGNLPQGTLRAMGPAMLPRWLSIAIGLLGLGLVAASFLAPGHRLERWSVRGPLFVLAGIFAFALTIRVFGLVVAGPLAMIIGGFATPEVRWKEIVVFAAVMTALCVGLFRYALNLPIPILMLPGLVQI